MTRRVVILNEVKDLICVGKILRRLHRLRMTQSVVILNEVKDLMCFGEILRRLHRLRMTCVFGAVNA